MYSKSKKISLLFLGVTAIACSRILLSLFADPEGPNLLIVLVGALGIFLVSLVAYVSKVSASKKLPLALGVQMLVSVVLFLVLK